MNFCIVAFLRHSRYSVSLACSVLVLCFYSIWRANSLRLRELRTRLVGKLSSICGTITRSSEVRPELLFGTFTCLDCNTLIKDVEQQFRYTEAWRWDCNLAVIDCDVQLGLVSIVSYHFFILCIRVNAQSVIQSFHLYVTVFTLSRCLVLTALVSTTSAGSSTLNSPNSSTGKSFESKKTQTKFR